MRTTFLATDPEVYAQTCHAVATASEPDYGKIKARTVVLAGEEDKTCPKATLHFLEREIGGEVKLVVVKDAAHWVQ